MIRLHARTHPRHDGYIMPKGCSNHLFPGQPGWGCRGLNMALIVQMMAASFSIASSLFKNRADIDHYMKGYNDTLMLLDYLEGQAVVDRNAAMAKWFKKVEPKIVDVP